MSVGPGFAKLTKEYNGVRRITRPEMPVSCSHPTVGFKQRDHLRKLVIKQRQSLLKRRAFTELEKLTTDRTGPRECAVALLTRYAAQRCSDFLRCLVRGLLVGLQA